jgi:hypothetical protein
LYNFKIWSSLFLASAIGDDDECSVESLLFEAELLLDDDDEDDEEDDDEEEDEEDEDDDGLNIFSHGRLIK